MFIDTARRFGVLACIAATSASCGTSPRPDGSLEPVPDAAVDARALEADADTLEPDAASVTPERCTWSNELIPATNRLAYSFAAAVDADERIVLYGRLDRGAELPRTARIQETSSGWRLTDSALQALSVGQQALVLDPRAPLDDPPDTSREWLLFATYAGYRQYGLDTLTLARADDGIAPLPLATGVRGIVNATPVGFAFDAELDATGTLHVVAPSLASLADRGYGLTYQRVALGTGTIEARTFFPAALRDARFPALAVKPTTNSAVLALMPSGEPLHLVYDAGSDAALERRVDIDAERAIGLTLSAAPDGRLDLAFYGDDRAVHLATSLGDPDAPWETRTLDGDAAPESWGEFLHRPPALTVTRDHDGALHVLYLDMSSFAAESELLYRYERGDHVYTERLGTTIGQPRLFVGERGVTIVMWTSEGARVRRCVPR